jgi:hypothetical protein
MTMTGGLASGCVRYGASVIGFARIRDVMNRHEVIKVKHEPIVFQ